MTQEPAPQEPAPVVEERKGFALVFSASKFLILVAVVLFAVSFVLTLLGVAALPWLIPLGLAFGFAGFLVP